MWKQAFWLAKKELKFHLLPFLSTLAVILLFGYLTAFLFQDLVTVMFGGESVGDRNNNFLIDIMFIGATPSFGAIFMSRPYLSFQTIKEDPYTKRLVLLRALPIPVSVLALSRTIFMLISLITMSVIFYSTMTLLLPDHIFEWISWSEYFLFILFWLGYALALGGMNPFIEYGTNGKLLHTIPYVFIGLIILIMIFFYQVIEKGIAETVLYLVRDIGFPLTVISIMVGVLGCYMWNRLLVKRLRRKDCL